MLFNSVTYIVFLVAIVCLFYALPRRPRLWLIFAASLTFYGFWRVEFVPVMLLSVVIDYFVALGMEKSSDQRRRKILLLISLCANLGLLGYFKYLNFVAGNLANLFNQPFQPFDIILPLGISFYTFQTISYTIDVYRGVAKAEKDFVLFGSYVTFFPQLVAGPILRAGEVFWQLEKRPQFSGENLFYGLKRILFGLFLKVVLADNISPLVDDGFLVPAAQLSALDVWTLAFLFGFQIYFDFSAYSHIAIGSARIMGIEFPENFNFPYIATSPKDFWKRWHISLSSWIRDYLYLPLTGAKGGTASTEGLEKVVGDRPTSGARDRALFLTWIIMGFWHGANWTFALWGLWHASLIYGYRLIRTLGLPSHKVVSWGFTIALAMLGWIPFRAASVSDSLIMWGQVLNPFAYTSLGFRENTYLVTALLLLFFLLTYGVRHYLLPKYGDRRWVALPAQNLFWAVVITLVFIFLRPIDQFIYFQF